MPIQATSQDLYAEAKGEGFAGPRHGDMADLFADGLTLHRQRNHTKTWRPKDPGELNQRSPAIKIAE